MSKEIAWSLWQGGTCIFVLYPEHGWERVDGHNCLQLVCKHGDTIVQRVQFSLDTTILVTLYEEPK